MKSKSKFAFAVLLVVIGLAAACTKPSETADTTGQDSTAQDTTVVLEPADTTSQDTTAAN